MHSLMLSVCWNHTRYGGSALIAWVGYPHGNEISPARLTMPSYVRTSSTYTPRKSVWFILHAVSIVVVVAEFGPL